MLPRFITLSMVMSLILAAPSAFATFPGENGQIAYPSVLDPNTSNARLAVFLSGSGPLTSPRGDFPPDNDNFPVWSPDGSKVAFIRSSSTDLEHDKLEVIGKDGTGLRQVISNFAFDQAPGLGHGISFLTRPAWTADGQRISFVHRNNGLPGLEGIWTVGSDGSGLSRTIPGNVADRPNWSVGNKMVYVCSFRSRGGFPLADLCVYDASIGAIRQLPIDLPTGMVPANVQTLFPQWSPDGQKIVFSFNFSTNENNHFVDRKEIFTINADGAGLTQLTTSPDVCPNQNVGTSAVTTAATHGRIAYRDPAYSPDGQSIVAFAFKYIVTGEPDPATNACSYSDEDPGLWTLSATGSHPSLLLATDQAAGLPDWQPLLGNLTLNLDDGHDNPLKGLKVELRKLDGTVVDDHPINTIGGTYVFENEIPPADYIVRVTLVDNAASPGFLPTFDIRYGPTPSEPVWLEMRITVQGVTTSLTRSFSQDVSNLVAYGPDSSADVSSRLDDMANIYFRVRQFVDWVKTRLTADTGETVEFYTFTTADPWGGSTDPNAVGAYYNPPNTAIVFSTAESEYENRDGVIDPAHDNNAPENSEWHEFTHHLFRTFINLSRCASGVNHAGYNNPDTCDSMNEGFAEFLPTLAAQEIDGVMDDEYDNFGFLLEEERKAWGYWKMLSPTVSMFVEDATQEDFAVASLFWDLVDTNSDIEITQVIGADGLHRPVIYTDQVTVPLRQLWNQLTSAHPVTVFDLRSSFGQPALTIDLDGDHVADVAPIDEVFLVHGFFPVDTDQTISDSHTTYHYDVGYSQRLTPSARRNGSVGATSHRVVNASGAVTATLIPRFHTPLDPHANLEIHVVNTAGMPLSDATINMTIRSPRLERTVSRRLASGDGALVHLELPPYFDYLLPAGAPLPACDPVHDFHVDVIVSATVNGVSSDSYSFDNCTYMQAAQAATGPAALSLTLTVPITRGSTPEVCDGVDNDLDGQVDEGLGTLSCGVGACARTVDACVNGVPQNCTPGAPSPEVCDGIDNNCNGQLDEGLGSLSCGVGACARTVSMCQNGAPQTCTPGTPTTEICGDSIDQDCDGHDAVCSSTGSTLFLHATNTALFLNATMPTATNAKTKDSPSVNFANGNPWKELGVWTANPGQVNTLSTLGNLRLWLGLRNSDDQGTQFDVKAEVRKNGQVIATGELFCVTGVTRNSQRAKEVNVPFASFAPVSFGSEPLSLRLLTRIGTNTEGRKCSGPEGSHNSALGLRLYFDATTYPAGVSTTP